MNGFTEVVMYLIGIGVVATVGMLWRLSMKVSVLCTKLERTEIDVLDLRKKTHGLASDVTKNTLNIGKLLPEDKNL